MQDQERQTVELTASLAVETDLIVGQKNWLEVLHSRCCLYDAVIKELSGWVA